MRGGHINTALTGDFGTEAKKAEGEGFEPSVTTSATLVFKTGTPSCHRKTYDRLGRVLRGEP